MVDEEKLSDIACRLTSLTAVLCGYCQNFMEESKEICNIVEFTEIIDKTAKELFKLL